MKRQSSILAGTALGLLMASAPLGASPLQGMAPSRATTPLVLAQAACAEGQSAEECAQGEPGKKKHRQEQQGEAQQQQGGGGEGEQQQPRKKRDQQQGNGGGEQSQGGGEQQQQPRRKNRDQQQQQMNGAAEGLAPLVSLAGVAATAAGRGGVSAALA